MKKLIVLSLLISSFLGSCKKYEYDSGLQLKSIKQRLAHEWIIASYSENKQDRTTYFNTVKPNFSTVFSKDGTFKNHAEGSYSIGNYQVPIEINESGNWYIKNKKNNLLLSTSNTTEEFKILKLSKTELWYTELNAPEKEYHFKAK